MKYSILAVLIIIFFNSLRAMEMGNPLDAHRFIEKAYDELQWGEIEVAFARVELAAMRNEKIIADLKKSNQIAATINSIFPDFPEKKSWGPGEVERLFDTLLVPQYPGQTPEEAIAVFFCRKCNY